MWQDLAYLESQNDKIEKQEKLLFPEAPKPNVTLNKVKEDEIMDPNFDEDSLALYGMVLSESLDKAPPGSEVAKPRAAIETVLTPAELAKKQKLVIKAEQLLADVPEEL